MSKKFEEEFLTQYLRLGLGSMNKSDIDALVMWLLDSYGDRGSPPLSNYDNQTVSERLKTPVSKVKRLRYDAALKYGGRIEDQARGRLLAALSKAAIDVEKEKICLVLEDSLAKNWLQGQLKSSQQIFDNTFNVEIIKVDAAGLFSVLEELFNSDEVAAFKTGYEKAKKAKTAKARREAFKKVALKFAEGAAKQAGSGVVAVLKASVGSP